MLTRVLVLLLSSVLALTLAGTTATAAPEDDGDTGFGQRAERRPEAARRPVSKALAARKALTDAKALFRKGAEGKPDRDATLALRELATRLDDLTTQSQRAEARQLLARPTDALPEPEPTDPKYGAVPSERVCGDHVCVHWVESGPHSVNTTDTDGDSVPNYVELTLATMEHVYDVEVGALGYFAPRSDATSDNDGGDARSDVYLAEIGDGGLYGYCSTDDPNADDASVRAISVFCVIDNDYSPSEFGNDNTPTENLQVTAAHEFFHAVQYAYDSYEDPWLVEGTAAWMEDQVYDGVNDNLQYLEESQLKYPFIPLDYTDYDLYGPYGSWVWWRFLSEWAGSGAADDASIIRRTWFLARTEATYSTQAMSRAISERGQTFADLYSSYGTWMRNPGRYFSEGNTYPRAPLDGTFTLTNGDRSTGTLDNRIDHMSHSLVRITPGSSLTGTWRAKISVNLPSTVTRPGARVLVYRKDGSLSSLPITLSDAGNGTRYVDFRRSVINYLEIDFTNASPLFDCYEETYQSCQGESLHDGQRITFNATAVR